MTAHELDAVRRVLAQRESLRPEALDGVLKEIAIDLVEYRRGDFAETYSASDRDALKSIVKRLQKFEDWLAGSSPWKGPTLCDERDRLVRAVAEVRVIMHLERLNAASPGRPADVRRMFLDDGVGVALAAAGVPMTTAPDGTFARVLEAVYAVAGVPESEESLRASGAARRALERHPEWTAGPPPKGWKRER